MNARILRQAAIGIAALGLLTPPGLLSAAESPAQGVAAANPAIPTILDVALGPKGTLRGQVVNASGAALAGVKITVRQQQNILAQTTSNPVGGFEIAGLSGGIFQVSTDQSEATFRLWAPATAPPGARPAVLVVHDPAALRGQSALGRLLSRPFAIAALVVTAVAVPVVVHQIEIEHQSGS